MLSVHLLQDERLARFVVNSHVRHHPAATDGDCEHVDVREHMCQSTSVYSCYIHIVTIACEMEIP